MIGEEGNRWILLPSLSSQNHHLLGKWTRHDSCCCFSFIIGDWNLVKMQTIVCRTISIQKVLSGKRNVVGFGDLLPKFCIFRLTTLSATNWQMRLLCSIIFTSATLMLPRSWAWRLACNSHRKMRFLKNIEEYLKRNWSAYLGCQLRICWGVVIDLFFSEYEN